MSLLSWYLIKKLLILFKNDSLRLKKTNNIRNIMLFLPKQTFSTLIDKKYLFTTKSAIPDRRLHGIIFLYTNVGGQSMSENADLIIVKTLLHLGISPNVKGYQYLRYIIGLRSQKSDCPINTSSLYAKAAKYFGTNPSAVERAVRHAIKTGWHRRDIAIANKIFFCIMQSKRDIPSNSLFISILAEYVSFADDDNI